jgi:hypothetical protein
MLTVTNAVTPEKLKERFNPEQQFVPPNSAADAKPDQILQTKNQLVRTKPSPYMHQGTALKKALLG